MSTQSNTQTTPLYFKFTQYSNQDVLSQIKTLTNNFDPQYGINQQFIDQITNKLSQDGSCLQGFLYAPKDSNVTRQVIGKGGCYFHLTTQNTAIHFIWHDRSTNKFLFWGQKYPLIRAMKIIHSRITKYSN